MKFTYVYILQSESAPETYFTGHTDDLHSRLAKHNEGGVPHTKKSRPWRIKTAVVFSASKRVLDFERYLKSGSGRGFAKQRL